MTVSRLLAGVVAEIVKLPPVEVNLYQSISLAVTAAFPLASPLAFSVTAVGGEMTEMPLGGVLPHDGVRRASSASTARRVRDEGARVRSLTMRMPELLRRVRGNQSAGRCAWDGRRLGYILSHRAALSRLRTSE